MPKLTYSILFSGLLLSLPALADDAMDWSKLSLNQLQNLKVTSVSKKSERAFDAPAAVYVITREDIRRSGTTSIAEALRLAPGVQVARAGANKWAISIRGFNDQFANKLLVLIDGRSVYTPLFSGVFWDVQDTLLEDVKQIEIIRGPGATLWGANAVDGVINIITEEAINTQGKYVSTTFGNKEKGSSSTRLGGKIGEDAHYRLYAKYTNNAEEKTVTGEGADDNGNSLRSGFRIDWEKTTNDMITVQGDVYRNSENQRVLLPSTTAPFTLLTRDNEMASGANSLMRWKHSYTSGASSTLQMYVDHAARSINYLGQSVDTLDVDFQHSLPMMHRNEVTVGAGYRLVSDQLDGTQYLRYTPDSRISPLYSAFIQDKIHLIKNKLFLTLGSKFEYNDYTQSEVQPSARLSFQPTEKQTLWGSISRAVRVPNRTMDDVSFAAAGTPFGFYRLVGNRNVESEELLAYELGYRVQPAKGLTLDLTGYLNQYDKLASNNPLNRLTVTSANANSGESRGFEISGKWAFTKEWDLSANYSYLKMDLETVNASQVTTEGKSPERQYTLNSHYMFPHQVEMTNIVYYMGHLPAINIPSYVRFDTVIAWKPKENFELSLVGQNLLNASQREFSGFIYSESERIGRTMFANARLWF